LVVEVGQFWKEKEKGGRKTKRKQNSNTMSWVDEAGLGGSGVAEVAAQLGVNKLEDLLLLSEEEWRKMSLTAVQRRKAFTTALQKSQKHWLDVVGLSQYRAAFDDMGVEAITDVPLLGNSEWESLAVKPFHQKKLVKFAQLFTSDDAAGTSFAFEDKQSFQNSHFFPSRGSFVRFVGRPCPCSCSPCCCCCCCCFRSCCRCCPCCCRHSSTCTHACGNPFLFRCGRRAFQGGKEGRGQGGIPCTCTGA
jgi:hypothetical protein